MDDRLKLAEAYYATARDLQTQGQYYIQVAQMLNAIGDRLSETNMRETQPTSSGGEGHGT